MRTFPLVLPLVLVCACAFDPAALGGPDGGAPSIDAAADGPTAIDGAAAPDAIRLPDAPPPDAAPIDAVPPDAPPAVLTGGMCVDETGCAPGFLCFDERYGWGASGYCSRTCTDDSECGPDAFCTSDIDTRAAFVLRICMRRCTGSTCPAGRGCATDWVGIVDMGGAACVPADTTAIDGDGCASFGDCNVNSVCDTNPFEYPGGFCFTLGCDPVTEAGCTGDADCIDTGAGYGYCHDTCLRPSDCRGGGYSCNTGGYCAAVHLPPGSACTFDGACGFAPWDCLEGGSFPGGYCGAMGCSATSANTCPGGTLCHDPTPFDTTNGDAYCAVQCASIATCRWAEGYSCLTETATQNTCRLF